MVLRDGLVIVGGRGKLRATGWEGQGRRVEQVGVNVIVALDHLMLYLLGFVAFASNQLRGKKNTFRDGNWFVKLRATFLKTRHDLMNKSIFLHRGRKNIGQRS